MSDSHNAVVAGGTGGIGEGIVRVLLEHGWSVHVPVRGSEKGDKLKAYTSDVAADRLHLVPADLSVSSEVASFREQVLRRSGTLELVVVSVGSSYYGYSLHKIPQTEWDRLLSENLATHFNLQREFMAVLHSQNRGAYVTLTGPEADFAHPETGLMSILASAQKMMARVEALEATGTNVHVYSVTSKTSIATRARGEQSGADWITPTELGAYVLALAEGKAAGSGQPLHVLDTRDQLRGLLKLPSL